MTTREIIFTCLKCEANYSVAHLPQPVTECPVCFWKPRRDGESKRTDEQPKPLTDAQAARYHGDVDGDGELT